MSKEIIRKIADAGIMSEASAGVIYRALCKAIPGLSGVIAGTHVIVPAEAMPIKVSFCTCEQGAEESCDRDHCPRAMLSEGRAEG